MGNEKLAPLPSFSSPENDGVVPQAAPQPAPGENPLGKENSVVPGSGEVDPPVDSEEMSFVLDAMEQLDTPAPNEDDSGKPAKAQPAAPQETAPAVVIPQVPQAAVPPVAAVPPTGQPAAPQPGTPPVTATPPVVPQPVDPAQQRQTTVPGQELDIVRRKMEENRDKFIQAAAQSYEGTFTDEDVEEIQTAPKKAFSKMAARLHADVVQNVLTVMTTQLPSMILGLSEAQYQQRAHADTFWKANPDLQPHAAQIIPMAQALRQANPELDVANFQKQLAAWARTTLGVTPPVQKTPTAPPRRPAAFQPAPTPGPAAAVQPVASDNPWEKIDQIMDADSRGVMDR